jgi:hypothetical protein
MGAVLGGVVLIGAPLTVLVFLAVPVDAFAFLVGQSALLGTAVLVVVAVLAMVRGASSGGTAYPIAHASGYSRSHVRRHENGHARVARALGCSARVDLDAGATYIRDEHLPPVQRAAISYGGEAAAGPSGCGYDRADADALLGTLPARERGAARREAWRIARRYA